MPFYWDPYKKGAGDAIDAARFPWPKADLSALGEMDGRPNAGLAPTKHMLNGAARDNAGILASARPCRRRFFTAASDTMRLNDCTGFGESNGLPGARDAVFNQTGHHCI